MPSEDYYEGRRAMTTEESAQAQRNKQVVRALYDAILRPDGPDLEAIEAVYDENYVVEFNWGHPDYRGRWWSAEENIPARMRLIHLIRSDFGPVGAILADGPSRVVSLITNEGTDLAGKPWKTDVIHLFELANGKLTRERVFFQDQVLLRDIALEREAAERETAQQ
jgi:ketosteroid isomerase-like protein